MAIKIEIDTPEELTENLFQQIKQMASTVKESFEPKFYTIDKVVEITGWSKPTVQDLFNRQDFPSCNFGKKKVVEASALKEYFSVPRRI